MLWVDAKVSKKYGDSFFRGKELCQSKSEIVQVLTEFSSEGKLLGRRPSQNPIAGTQHTLGSRSHGTQRSASSEHDSQEASSHQVSIFFKQTIADVARSSVRLATIKVSLLRTYKNEQGKIRTRPSVFSIRLHATHCSIEECSQTSSSLG